MTEQLYTVLSLDWQKGYVERAVNISDIKRFYDMAMRDGLWIFGVIPQRGFITNG
jgi:hypothetical protein